MMQAKQIIGTLFMVTSVFAHQSACTVNNRPVIGVLAQESYDWVKQYGNEFVLSEYVKYLEMSGAAVVIVKGEQPKEYYTDIFKQINGILIPGGGVDLMTSPFARSNRILYALAVKANDNGDYFPIWGTCQGFEMMTVLTAKKNLLQRTDSENLLLPLTLLPAYNESRLLGTAPKDIIYYLTHEDITANFHHMCLPTETYRQSNSLNKFYRVISVNKGRKGLEYVSTMEAFDYPFYGVQWHPEKNIFNRELSKNVSHSFHAVQVSQYFANFFVNEARKNFHKFSSEEERSHTVIENDDRVYTPRKYFEGFFYNVTKN